MLLNDVGPLLTAVQFQLSLYNGCRPVYVLCLWAEDFGAH